MKTIKNNKEKNKTQINPTIRFFFLLIILLSVSACSTVRDATDWVPGVDSNEEIKKKEMEKQRQKRAEQNKNYHSKAAYVPTGPQAEIDAEVNVIISQRYAEDPLIEAGEIGIEVHSGVVTLTGAVQSEEAAIKAISLAKSVKGVTRVISKLIIILVR